MRLHRPDVAEPARTYLGDTANILVGYPFKSREFRLTPQKIKLVRGENVGEGTLRWGDRTRFWEVETAELHRYALKTDDIVISMDGNVGKNIARVRQEDLPALLVQRVARLRAKPGFDQKYLYYLVRSKLFREYLDGVKTGTTIAHISGKQIEKFSFTARPFKEQAQIGAALRSFDDKIELNREMNITLEAIGQALFKRWFVDFEFPNEHGKPYKSSGGKMVESELGEIPEGWRVGTLGQIAKITSGRRPEEKSDEKSTVFSVPLIGASKIMGYVKNPLFSEKILVTGRVGTHGIIQRFVCPSFPSDNTLVITSKYTEHTYQALRKIDFDSLNVGSTQPLITQSTMLSLKLVIGPESLLSLFEKTVSGNTNLIHEREQEMETLANVRNILLPRLMNGIIRVPT